MQKRVHKDLIYTLPLQMQEEVCYFLYVDLIEIT